MIGKEKKLMECVSTLVEMSIVQLCKDGYHAGNCKTLRECREWAELGY